MSAASLQAASARGGERGTIGDDDADEPPPPPPSALAFESDNSNDGGAGLGVRDVERDPPRAAVFALVNACAASDAVWPRAVALGGVAMLVGLLSSGHLQAQHMALDYVLSRTAAKWVGFVLRLCVAFVFCVCVLRFVRLHVVVAHMRARSDDAFARALTAAGGIAAVAPLVEPSPVVVSAGGDAVAMAAAIEARRCKGMATLAAFSAREQVSAPWVFVSVHQTRARRGLNSAKAARCDASSIC